MDSMRIQGKEFLKDYEEPISEFPDSYEIIDEIKSPLNVLWYNIRNEFPDKYPAKMPEDFARDMIRWYSNKGELIWDPMCGSGIVPRVATREERKSVGTDINPASVNLARSHDPEGYYQIADARTFQMRIKPDLILFSPPFGLSIASKKDHYSEEKDDVSRSETYKEFFAKMKVIFQNCWDNLPPGGRLIFDARDRTKDKVYWDLAVIFRNIAVEIGFEMICRYWYVLIPYRQMTFKHKSGYIMPMVSAMDAYVFYKPEDSRLTDF